MLRCLLTAWDAGPQCSQQVAECITVAQPAALPAVLLRCLERFSEMSHRHRTPLPHATAGGACIAAYCAVLLRSLTLPPHAPKLFDRTTTARTPACRRELEELAGIYMARGLKEDTARLVAQELTEADVVGGCGGLGPPDPA